MQSLLILFSSVLMALLSFIAQTVEASISRDALWVSERLGVQVRVHLGCAGTDLIEIHRDSIAHGRRQIAN